VSAAATSKPLELRLTRVFDAPRSLVFEVWTKPEHLARWWGPKGFTLPKCEVDLRPGGAFHFVMHGPDGNDYPFKGEYVEITPPERIVFTGMVHDNNASRTTVTFTESGGKTTVSVHQTYSFESDATRGAPVGWGQSLDRLAEYLAKA
jgi:uncharacterized protein YndB with AHSA1/START domain